MTRRRVTVSREEDGLGDLRVRQVLAKERQNLRLACRHRNTERRHLSSVPVVVPSEHNPAAFQQ